MNRTFGIVIVLALLLAPTVTVGASAPAQPDPLRPDCVWVPPVTHVVHHDAVTHEEWVPPTTHIVHHDAVTHQEVVIDVPAWDELVVDKEGFYTCPGPFTFTDSRPATYKQVCPSDPAAYTSTDKTKDCKMAFGQGRDKYFLYADKVTVVDDPAKSFSVTFSYNKDDRDPTKCHRPDDGEDGLAVPGWASADFKQQYPEWMDAVYTPPVTHVVHHDAVTHEVTVIDVPAWDETVTDTEGHFVTVVDTPAYDETVVDKEGYWDCPPLPVPGCTDPAALNYDPLATVDDGSCIFPPPPPIIIKGCTDRNAENYNPKANEDDGSCQYIVWHTLSCPLWGAADPNSKVKVMALFSYANPGLKMWSAFAGEPFTPVSIVVGFVEYNDSGLYYWTQEAWAKSYLPTFELAPLDKLQGTCSKHNHKGLLGELDP